MEKRISRPRGSHSLEISDVQRCIYVIRDAQVMLDRDLAVLYGVEVKQLNRQVKRNIERFSSDFMFQLSKEECSRCQIGTLNRSRGSTRCEANCQVAGDVALTVALNEENDERSAMVLMIERRRQT